MNVNDKDTRGAFQGFYPVVFFFRHEKIVQVNGGPGDFGIGAQYARSQCEHLGALPGIENRGQSPISQSGAGNSGNRALTPIF